MNASARGGILQSKANILDLAAKKHAQVISGESIDWERWLTPEDKSQVIPAESLSERGKEQLLLGKETEHGLYLPWEKTRGKVLMKPGKLIVWAGWSRHGKTQMLKQAMLSAIKQGERPLVASMEEEIIDVWKDMARLYVAKDTYKPRELDQFTDFIRGELYFYDQQGAVSGERIQAVIRYAASELKVTQVMVDSLMMLKVPRDDYDAQHRFVSSLKTTAKDTGCTIHLVAHMRKREGKNGEQEPGTIHDISGGHEIGSIADSVFIVWRDMERKGAHSSILKVDKQRGAVNWTGTIGLNFHETSRQFVEEHYPIQFIEERGENF